MHNADLGVELMDAIIEGRGLLDMRRGAREMAHNLAGKKDRAVLDLFVYTANAQKGWMVPNQYWTPGVLSPMPIMGKYYMHYGDDFLEPRALGRKNAERMVQELILDNAGFCRFHRGWAEEMVPEIIGTLFGVQKEFVKNAATTAGLINSRNSAVFWESKRNIDFVRTTLTRMRDVGQNQDPKLAHWIDYFEKDKHEAALDFWFEIQKGVHETLVKMM
jgi:glyceraldehyde-3-phosphate dehydrogenase (ferredoxin)